MSMRNHYDGPEPTPEEQLRASGKRSLVGLFVVNLLALIGIACVLAANAHGATASDDSMTIQLKRGSTIVTLVPTPVTLADCETRKAGLIAIDAETKFTGTSTYSCIETRRSVVTFSANPPPPPPPPPVGCAVSAWTDWVLGTPSACVSGSQTRTDARTRTITTPAANGGAACPALSESRTVTLTCSTTAPLTAPTLSAPTVAPHPTLAGRYNVTLTWSPVSGADHYEMRRCTGLTCTSMTLIKSDVATTSYTNTNLPAGLVYRYKVRAMRGTEAGPMSEIVTIATPGATTPPPPPPPPPPPAAGSAKLSWTPPTTNTNGTSLTNLVGYRVDYGTSAAALTSQIVIPNPGVSTYVVDNLAAGTWYFGVVALAGDSGCLEPAAQCIVISSVRSNLVTRVVP
jgi:hypothetical protein